MSWPDENSLLDLIDPWLRGRRWFPGDDQTRVRVLAIIDHEIADKDASLRTYLLDTPKGILNVPLVKCSADREDSVGGEPIASGAWGCLYDAAATQLWVHAWLTDAFRVHSPFEVNCLELRDGITSTTVFTGEQSNTSVRIESSVGTFVVKLYRVLALGTHPDLEVGAALAETGWRHVAPPIAYSILDLPVDSREGTTALTALLCPFVANAKDGFAHFVSLARTGSDPSEDARSLGLATREMHDRLADKLGVEDGPLPKDLAERIAKELRDTGAEVADLTPSLPHKLIKTLTRLADVDTVPQAIRIHGDYHLGQTLLSDRWYILDFEGEPLRPISQRRQRDLGLRDVAGMVRSFGYARAQGERTRGDLSAEDLGPLDGDAWESAAVHAYLDGYFNGQAPSEAEELLIHALMVEKAAYELRYEYRMRPDWLAIPLRALQGLAEA